MKKLFVYTVGLLSFALVLSATDEPKMQTFLGYNLTRFNPSSGYTPSFNANGGGGQFVYNFSHWIGGVFDMGVATKGTLRGAPIDSTVINFVAGPRFAWHNHSRFIPYGEVLFGGAYTTASAQITALPLFGPVVSPAGIVPSGVPLTVRVNSSHTGFAMLAGGGLDIRISKHMSFRPVGADYYLTHLPDLLTGGSASNRNNFRYTAGVNFWFGAR
jgi:hypothetical protein